MYISPPVDRSFLLFPSDCTNVPTGRPPLPAHGHARAATQPRPAGPPAAPLSQRAEPQPGSARGDARWFGRKGFALWFCASAGHFYFLLSLPPHPPTYRPPPPPNPPPPAALPLLCGGCSGRESSRFCPRLRIPLLPFATRCHTVLWSRRRGERARSVKWVPARAVAAGAEGAGL